MSISLKRYWALLTSYLRPQWRRPLLLALLLGVSIALQLISPQILRYFIDVAKAGGSARSLVMAGLLFMGAALLNQGVSVTATYVSETIAWTATNALRCGLARHCIHLDMTFHKAHTPGEMIERLDGDVTALAGFFSQFVVYVLTNAVMLVGVLVVLYGVDWRAGLAFAAFSAAGLVVLMACQNIAVPYWEAARQAAADLSGYLEERLAGTEDIRSSGAVSYALRRLYELMRRCLHTERHAYVKQGWFIMGSIGVITLGNVLAFVVGSYLYRAGAITIGTVYMIFCYTQMVLRPLLQITGQMEDLQKAAAAIERIERLLGTESKIREGAGEALPQGALSVEFRRVDYSYDSDTNRVLQDFSFRLRPGRVLGLLGRTGAGKTTLTRLLFRLYDPCAGAICLGGVDIRGVRLRDLRRRVGIVTQDVQLFQATVRDNLTLFDPTITDKEILQVLDDLGLMGWFRTLPHGLDTELQTGGAGLSAGEAQLLAFTRVFLRDPGLVILDEASSRLDPAAEQLIEHAVEKLLYGRTGIIIAHRLRTVHRVDEIMIIEEGLILEHGERTALAEDPGSRFYQLLQIGLEEALA